MHDDSKSPSPLSDRVSRPPSEADAAKVSAMRASLAPLKGTIRGPEARVLFDEMIAMTPAAAEVRLEAGTVGGIPGWWCLPPSAKQDARLLYVHGGGYVLGSARASCHLASQFASRAGVDTFVPDYRLAPEHPFPAAFNDVAAAYEGMAEAAPSRAALAGESGGGGLALALLAITRAPSPYAVAVLSP